MTAATIVKIILAFLQLANNLYGYLHDKGLIQEGEDRQIAKQLAEMARRSPLIKAAAENVEKMSDAEVIRELERNKDFRD